MICGNEKSGDTLFVPSDTFSIKRISKIKDVTPFVTPFEVQELFKTGKTGRIDKGMHKRILRRLDAMDSASKPENMKIPGFDFHGLQGRVPKRYTVHINGPWCVTFEWNDGAENVDYVQYH